jgi:hypothetical protein
MKHFFRLVFGKPIERQFIGIILKEVVLVVETAMIVNNDASLGSETFVKNEQRKKELSMVRNRPGFE